ncbi:hypothetical protein ACFVWN_25830 [Nocardiopsis flavescens]|uniref:hypothetical protein n=1 Tax=Nocardiopsis flavescens TaxID=758803 RepID=UPI0036D9FB2A
MNGIGFLPLLWVNSALEAGLFPTTRAHTVASAIAEAADRDGRWCYLYLDTLTRRCGGTLSRSTAKRALRDLLHHHLVRKLPRTHLRTFFAQDLATGRRRADNLPDVLELLIPASAFTHHHPAVLEEINHARAQLGEEPLTPHNRPDLPALRTPRRTRPTRTTEAMGTTGVQGDPSRGVTLNPREGSQRPTDPSPAHPHPNDPPPHPLRTRATTGAAVPRPRTEAAPAATRTPEHAPAPRQAPDATPPTPPAPVRPPARTLLPEPPTSQPPLPRPRSAPDTSPPAPPSPRTAPAWAYDLLARIPDAALHHPHRDRTHLATRLHDLARQGVPRTALAHALTGWEHTTRPYAALNARLTTPDTLHTWNTHTHHHTPHKPAPDPRPTPDHPAAFTLDTHGKATHTCPHHPTLRNTPGGTCTICGHPCRTHPDHTPPPTKPTTPRHNATLDHLLGPPGPDTRFTTPKCDNERCNPDPHSPRYRTILRRTPDDRTITAIPCPTCGDRRDRAALTRVPAEPSPSDPSATDQMN